MGFCVWSYSNSLDPESLSLCLSRISVIPPELIHTTTHRCINSIRSKSVVYVGGTDPDILSDTGSINNGIHKGSDEVCEIRVIILNL